MKCIKKYKNEWIDVQESAVSQWAERVSVSVALCVAEGTHCVRCHVHDATEPVECARATRLCSPSSSTCPSTHHSALSTLYWSTALSALSFSVSTLLLFLPSCQSPKPRATVTDTRLSAYPFLFIAILPSCRGRVDQICYFHYSISSSLDFPCLLFQTLFIPLIFTSPGHLYHLQLINW